jgi:hypothetical protein
MQFMDDKRSYMWFQQDLTTAHTVHNSLMALEGVFGDRIISHGSWLAHSPDITVNVRVVSHEASQAMQIFLIYCASPSEF